MFNWMKTAMLMAAIMALFGIVGGLVGGGLQSLFSTYSPSEERIARLRTMAR